MTETERIVVVGTGVAGLRAAERLRELNFDGELVMVSEEPYRPYHRPALNKQLIMGAVRPRDIVLPVHTDLDAIWRYATRAVRLDAEEHVLHLPGGEEMRYDGLVIATGVQAKHLPGAPRHDPRVQVLRTIGDAVAVQRAIAHSKGAVAVIGGGFVGCELASAAREMGRDATIILRDLELLDRVPGPAVSEMVTALHRSNGVQLITQANVKHWVPMADGMALHLSTGQVVVASVVVLGVGGVPAVDWLRGSGLILDDGVMCDPTCHAIGAEDIVVAGDVARWPNLRFDSMPRRIEHWLNAVEMGRAAAENLLTGKHNAEPFTPVPRFWSEQHGVRIQAAGIPVLAQDTVPLSGSVMVGHRVTGYVSDGSLVGVVAWDSPRGMLRWTSELERQSTNAMRKRQEAARIDAARRQAPRPLPPVVPPPMPALNPDLEHTMVRPVHPDLEHTIVLSTPLRSRSLPPPRHNGRPVDPAPTRTNGHSFDPAPPSTNGHPVGTGPRRTNGHPVEHPSFPSMPPVPPPPPRRNGRPVDPAPTHTNGHAFDPPPPRTNGHSFDPPPPRRNGRPVDSAPTNTNGHAFDPAPPRTNGHAFDSVPPRNNGHSFDSPLRRNGHPVEHPSFPSMPPVPPPPNGRSFDTLPPNSPPQRRTNGHPVNSAPPRNNGHSFEPTPPPRNNGHSYESTPPPRNNGHSFDHPSFPSMPPVPPQSVTAEFDHPSFPSMPPVSPPPARNGHPVEHPSFPSMPPVPPPPARNGHPVEHPSFPSMRPVPPPTPPRNGRSFDHPSFPSMPAIPPDERLSELFVRDGDMPGMHVPDLSPIDLRTVIR